MKKKMPKRLPLLENFQNVNEVKGENSEEVLLNWVKAMGYGSGIEDKYKSVEEVLADKNSESNATQTLQKAMEFVGATSANDVKTTTMKDLNGGNENIGLPVAMYIQGAAELSEDTGFDVHLTGVKADGKSIAILPCGVGDYAGEDSVVIYRSDEDLASLKKFVADSAEEISKRASDEYGIEVSKEEIEKQFA
jgi:hypothetical protein